MTKREKILRDAIIKIDKKSRDGDEPVLAERLISIDRITANAFIQADAVEDGPSEEAEAIISHMEDILKYGAGPGSQRTRHVISKIEKYMGAT